MSRIPFLKLSSDVRDVVYLTWLVPVQAAEAFVPKGVSLWQRNGLTPFTVLSYQHVHFGPSVMGFARQSFPSPRQSNWRLYLDTSPDSAGAARTVWFLKNIISSFTYAAATRLFSDALPTHLPEKFVHRRHLDQIHTEIQPGDGSSPALSASVRVGGDRSLNEAFSSVFESWNEAVSFLACQDAAVAITEDTGQLAYAEIRLPIEVSNVLPASLCQAASMTCSLLPELQPVSDPFCFVVERVRFEAISERLLST